MNPAYHSFVSHSNITVEKTASDSRIDIILENQSDKTMVGEIVFSVPSEVFVRPAFSSNWGQFTNAGVHEKNQLTTGARMPYPFEFIHQYHEPREETITVELKLDGVVVERKEVTLSINV